MPKILIIDDDPGVIRVLRRVLELEGYTVSEARDGREGLRCMERDPADLVISDVYMPDMDGIEFLIRIRKVMPDAKVVAMSGGGYLTTEEVLYAASVLGAVAVLRKPFTRSDVLEVVTAAA